jgi:hypothetical protein
MRNKCSSSRDGPAPGSHLCNAGMFISLIISDVVCNLASFVALRSNGSTDYLSALQYKQQIINNDQAVSKMMNRVVGQPYDYWCSLILIEISATRSVSCKLAHPLLDDNQQASVYYNYHPPWTERRAAMIKFVAAACIR